MPIVRLILSLFTTVLCLILLTRCAAYNQISVDTSETPTDSSLIDINTLPPCGHVYVDGELMGIANQGAFGLTPGIHQIKIVINELSFDTSIFLKPGLNKGLFVQVAGGSLTTAPFRQPHHVPVARQPGIESPERRARTDSVWTVMRRMPGWHGIESTFTVSHADINLHFFMPRSLLVRMRPKDTSSVVSQVTWYDSVGAHGLVHTWVDFGSVYDGCIARISRFPWLGEWLHSGPPDQKRISELHFFGTSLNTVTASRFKPHRRGYRALQTIWKKLHFPGEPAIEVALKRNGEGIGELYFSDQSDTVLVASMQPDDSEYGSMPKHWLDTTRVDSRGVDEEPTCALADTRGIFRIIEIREILGPDELR